MVAPLTAPLVEGDQVGTVAVLNGDEVLVEAPLQALHPVEEAGWFKAPRCAAPLVWGLFG